VSPRDDGQEVTELLQALGAGNDAALEELVPLVYDELRRLARAQMRSERAGHTLNTTGLVHEAFLRLRDQRKADWANRAQFFSVASLTMRRILVNWANAKKRQKRGDGVVPERLDEVAEPGHEVQVDQILAVDQALNRLSEWSPRSGKVVECRYFGGLTVEETAAALAVSTRTVKREWSLAQSWLHRELSRAT